MEIHTAYYSSPIGTIEIKGNEDGVSSILFLDEKTDPTKKIDGSLKEVVYQLDEYFIGIRKEFGLKLNPLGSEFQKRVWEKLTDIPFGKTCSYLDISKLLGDENATRAVGNANGKNPLSIIIPCHRVIGSDGKLTGYAGGLWRKQWLLKHETEVIFGKQTELF
ncbi:MAG: methylated-DNA--[protein]-cysteine S-methyltransferase [Bacteroidetes bacterium]|nr:methylated-DNA--[protein]-cysteine S-methyltransferase [Bacteroidota bacterium]